MKLFLLFSFFFSDNTKEFYLVRKIYMIVLYIGVFLNFILFLNFTILY